MDLLLLIFLALLIATSRLFLFFFIILKLKHLTEINQSKFVDYFFPYDH